MDNISLFQINLLHFLAFPLAALISHLWMARSRQLITKCVAAKGVNDAGYLGLKWKVLYPRTPSPDLCGHCNKRCEAGAEARS